MDDKPLGRFILSEKLVLKGMLYLKLSIDLNSSALPIGRDMLSVWVLHTVRMDFR